MNFQGDRFGTLRDIVVAYQGIRQSVQNLSQAYCKMSLAFVQWGLEEDPKLSDSLDPLISLLASWSSYIIHLVPDIDVDEVWTRINVVQNQQNHVNNLRSLKFRHAYEARIAGAMGVNQLHKQGGEVDRLSSVLRKLNAKLPAEESELLTAQRALVQFWIDMHTKHKPKIAEQTMGFLGPTEKTYDDVGETAAKTEFKEQKEEHELTTPDTTSSSPLKDGLGLHDDELSRTNSTLVGTSLSHIHLVDEVRDVVDGDSSEKLGGRVMEPTLSSEPSHPYLEQLPLPPNHLYHSSPPYPHHPRSFFGHPSRHPPLPYPLHPPPLPYYPHPSSAQYPPPPGLYPNRPQYSPPPGSYFNRPPPSYPNPLPPPAAPSPWSSHQPPAPCPYGPPPLLNLHQFRPILTVDKLESTTRDGADLLFKEFDMPKGLSGPSQFESLVSDELARSRGVSMTSLGSKTSHQSYQSDVTYLSLSSRY
ncbi:hypothetical protein JAAARDRAFT_42097 [Jaapia argillacea MUCL 33604]|uniref:Uncharacterized protein n=1 Tax=Jaapia argillacea MUCL 33604 TaxID=933084 RepID=A0A067P9H7_9AGAM|nr:hypothetical protein JAAARDRAFT_42097 [Jaapia argillacea MUCL 33604]